MNLIDHKFLSNTAVDFFNLAHDRCLELFNREYKDDGSLYVRITAPATNLSFAVELMLKSLLLKLTGSFPKKHNLVILYNKLPEFLKGEIIINYSGKTVSPRLFPSFRYLAMVSASKYSKDKPKHSSVAKEIDYELELHDESFVNWRYVFSFTEKADKLEYNFGFMIKFFLACSECR
jgi:hypothetical protein